MYDGFIGTPIPFPWLNVELKCDRRPHVTLISDLTGYGTGELMYIARLFTLLWPEVMIKVAVLIV